MTMKRTPIAPDLRAIPEEFHRYFADTPALDSSCSANARVIFLDREGGMYLKSARAGSLKQEAEMDAYFASLGLGPEVLAYSSLEQDWLLTRAVKGEDCLYPDYLADPNRLAEIMAQMLCDLHSRNHSLCPVQNHTERYLTRATENYRGGHYDAALFPDNWGYASAEDARAVIEANAKYLKTDTLLHGDYCLPNILLDNWKPSGFIDVGGGGVGDKHVDLFWGAWTLNFNLKTDKYCQRFLDAYGRTKFEPEMLRVVAALEVFL
jgi:kanamycin kinase